MSEPAFPCVGAYGSNHTDSLGMTLRDYFAAKSIQTCVDLLFTYEEDSQADFYKDIATRAYQFADAMLKAREES